MQDRSIITIRLAPREILVAASLFVLALLLLFAPTRTEGQEVQKNFKEKFNIADSSGGIGVATSADGKYVYVAGPQGIVVSDDFGKTGSWVQTVRLK
jgi:hypothetical protein